MSGSATRDVLGVDFVTGEQRVAIQQVRREVLSQSVGLAATILLLFILALFPRDAARLASDITVLAALGLVSIGSDLLWWRYLRSADPFQAFERLQARDENGGPYRRYVVRGLALGLFFFWHLFVARR